MRWERGGEGGREFNAMADQAEGGEREEDKGSFIGLSGVMDLAWVREKGRQRDEMAGKWERSDAKK